MIVAQHIAVERISAPCPECVALWLSDELIDFEHLQSLVLDRKNDDSEVCVLINDGSELRGHYYPHPFCGFHVTTSKATHIRQLEAGPFGPIKRLWRRTVPDGAPAISLVAAETPYPMGNYPYLGGRGIDVNPELADTKALMEAIERYCSFLPPRTRLHWGSPEDFARAIKISAPADKPRWWCETKNLKLPAGSPPMLVPLEHFQLASVCTVQDPLVKAGSSGMAANYDYNAALQSGLCEVLERAGLGYLCGKRVERLWDIDSLPAAVMPALRVCRELGFDATVLPDASAIGFYTCAVLLKRYPNAAPGPALVCGTGGSWSAAKSVEHAVNEAYAQLLNAIEIWRSPISESFGETHARLLLYFEEDRACELFSAWGIDTARSYRFSSEMNVVLSLSEALDRVTTEIVAIDRGNTLTDYLGLEVIQVSAPQFSLLNSETLCVAGLPHPFD